MVAAVRPLRAARVALAAFACAAAACTVFDGLTATGDAGGADAAGLPDAGAEPDGAVADPPDAGRDAARRFCEGTAHTSCADFDGVDFDIGSWQGFDVSGATHARDDAAVSQPYALRERLLPNPEAGVGTVAQTVLRRVQPLAAKRVEMRFALKIVDCPSSANAITFAAVAPTSTYVIGFLRSSSQGASTFGLVEQRARDGGLSLVTLQAYSPTPNEWHDVQLVVQLPGPGRLGRYELKFDGVATEGALTMPPETVGPSLILNAGLSINGPTNGCEAVFDDVVVDSQ